MAHHLQSWISLTGDCSAALLEAVFSKLEPELKHFLTSVWAVPLQAQLPLRLGMSLTAGRCDPQTSAGIIANETATGCGNAADNAALAPSPSMALSY